MAIAVLPMTQHSIGNYILCTDAPIFAYVLVSFLFPISTLFTHPRLVRELSKNSLSH